MNTKTHMSPKAKKILVGVGITFGTALVFLISFILSFSLIVNPISFANGADDGEIAKENEELREKVQTLTDEVEMLNVTVDKYKANQSAPAVVVTPDPVSQQSKPQQSEPVRGENTETAQPSESTQDGEQENDEEFSPETVTGTSEETPEDVEEPITIIDIAE